MIVAWHEMPGIAPPRKDRPVGYSIFGALPLAFGTLERSNVEDLDLWLSSLIA